MAYTINVVVGTPVKQPDPEVVYDGPFMYNLFSHQQTENQIDKVITDCFKDKPALYELYKVFIDNISRF